MVKATFSLPSDRECYMLFRLAYPHLNFLGSKCQGQGQCQGQGHGNSHFDSEYLVIAGILGKRYHCHQIWSIIGVHIISFFDRNIYVWSWLILKRKVKIVRISTATVETGDRYSIERLQSNKAFNSDYTRRFSLTRTAHAVKCCRNYTQP